MNDGPKHRVGKNRSNQAEKADPFGAPNLLRRGLQRRRFFLDEQQPTGGVAMNLAPRIFLFFLSMLCALASCSSDRPFAGSASGRSFDRGTAVASVPGLAKQVGAPFLRHAVPTRQDEVNAPGEVKKEPFFSTPLKVSFERASDGTLTAVTQDESPATFDGGQPKATASKDRISPRFPATSSGALEVTAGEKPGVWIKEHLVGASKDSSVQVSEGRVVYTGAKPGVDRVYEVSGQRVEEYLRFNDANALQGVQYEVETGPGIADLVVDGSGYGLMAVDTQGKQVLKAPQPTGVDARGNAIQGKLVVRRTSARHFSVRLALMGESTALHFPMLIDPSWVAAGSMGTARYRHAATSLGNGKVIVTGGSNIGGFLSSAEIYDPGTNTWSAIVAMSTTRERHSATLLGNGKVLVTGGYNGSYLPTAELYDPSTNTWSAAGALITARNRQSATLLSDGNVLIAGGYGTGGYVSTAELYNPVTNVWSAAGSLNTARNSHSAILLANGKVFVVGGYSNGNSIVANSEVYDPATNTWSAAASLTVSRADHSATLLENGKLIVVGGVTSGNGIVASAELYEPSTNSWSTSGSLINARCRQTATLLGNGKVLVAGGSDTNGKLASAELYDPSANTWSVAEPLSIAREEHTATLLSNGKVLVAGGVGGSILSGAELYNPATNTWSNAGSLPTERGFHTATLLNNGNVLVAGGFNGSAVASAELYHPATNTWSSAGVLNSAREEHSATLLTSGKVLVVGGNKGFALASAELYDPVTNSWSSAASMATARANCSVTLLSTGQVLVVGGLGTSGYVATAELYNPATNTWSNAAAPASARGLHTATLLNNGNVLIAGGSNGNYIVGAELYDPLTNTWSSAGALTTGRRNHTATLLGNGKVLIAGGYKTSFLNAAELYDPIANTWSTAGSLSAIRGFHTATLLDNGKVLVAGGGQTNSNSPSPIAGAELYDLSTNSWSLAASLTTARHSHTATILSNGKILVAGGYNSTTNTTNTAELYAPGLMKGAACGVSTECDSGFCVNGVCCDVGCSGGCGVCSVDLGASTDGTCSAISAGAIGGCSPFVCSGSSTLCPTSCTSDSDCVSDHFCDKNGMCLPQKGQASTCSPVAGADCFESGCRVCSTGFCVSGICCDSACDGSCDACETSQGAQTNGVCSAVSFGSLGVPSCAPYLCDGTQTVCPTSCDNSTDCSNGFVCSAQNTCVSLSLKMQGDLCAVAADCQSNFCVDGVCCESQCGSTCMACSSGLTGAASGLCKPVLVGQVDPLCPTAPPCGADGKCDGAGACRPNAPATFECGQTSCVGAQVQGFLCDGQGNCVDSPPTSCNAGYVCVSAMCPDSCVDDSQCANTHFCDGTTCAAKQMDGLSCNDDSQCQSGQCVDSVCCNSVCDGPCQSCDGDFNTEGAGKCSPVADGKDPGNDCPQDPNNVCGADGMCDGQGQCRPRAKSGEPCGQPVCDGDSVQTQACDGFGKCLTKSDACEPFTCDPDKIVCKSTCVTPSDCSEGATCSQSGLCTLGEASCSNKTTVKQADGSLVDCAPYVCQTGQCTSTCAGDNDCASTASCENGQCVDNGGEGGQSGSGGSSGASNGAAPKGDSGCGCRVTGTQENTDRRALGILALGMGIIARRANRYGKCTRVLKSVGAVGYNGCERAAKR